jgi:hypothetical protein
VNRARTLITLRLVMTAAVVLALLWLTWAGFLALEGI